MENITITCISHTPKTVPIEKSIGMVLLHDITEIRKDDFKGVAFKKGHIIKEQDLDHLKRIGKENIFAFNIGKDELHEDDAAIRIANSLIGQGVRIQGEPKEGKINLAAQYRGLLKIDSKRLLRLNMLGEIMCATLHNNTYVHENQIVAGTRAIPLVIKKNIVVKAERLLKRDSTAVIEVQRLNKPKAGIVITGNEIYYRRVKDAFAPILTSKIEALDGEVIDIYFSPDNVEDIVKGLNVLIQKDINLLITTGGMSVDPDDLTRFAISKIGARGIVYGSSVLPGAMFMVSYIDVRKENTITTIPILSIPACGMYYKTTIFDVLLPRILAGEMITRKEIAELGHGGLCLNCKVCNFPICPFCK
ncbi:MAG TPA: molybdopterin-binding protein [Nitrospirae bacterium]|nr:molybdopterin-binding protein [Nitrospirota bacterium]